MSARLPEPGHDLDGYRIDRELGRGGMGAVFLARKGGVRFAIKLLLTLDPEQRLRFEREARAMAAVSRHPNIVTIHTLGRFRGKPYVVMDYIEGGDLRGLLKDRGRLELDEALELMATVADAVGFVHNRGLIHRDLKPENILIRAEGGAPVVTDFGLTRGADLEALTRTGALAGTPHYMAPEQIEAREAITPATDVWAMGVILYELLSGRRPFEGAGLAELGRSIFRSEPAPIEVPEAVAAILERSLAKAPGHRFLSGAVLREALEEARGAVAPWPRWLRRAIATLALAAALAAAAPFLPSYDFRAREARDRDRLHSIVGDLDPAFLAYADELVRERFLAQERLRVSFTHSPMPGGLERLRAIYDELQRARADELSLDSASPEDLQRARIVLALFRKSESAPLPLLERDGPLGHLAPIIIGLHQSPGRSVSAGLTELGSASAPGEARLLRLVALLSHVRARRWREACEEARRLREEHGEAELEAAVLRAVSRPDLEGLRDRGFWVQVFERGLVCGDALAIESAFVALAEREPEKSGERLRAALGAAQDQSRPELTRRLFEALEVERSQARGRAQQALEESILVASGELGSALTAAQARTFALTLGTYVTREGLSPKQRFDAFSRALELHRVFPELAMPYPTPTRQRFIGASKQSLVELEELNFLGLRRLIFDITSREDSRQFARPDLFYDFLRAAFAKGIYLEVSPGYLYALKNQLALKATDGAPADRFVLAQIDLHAIRALIPPGDRRALFEELRAGLEQVFEAWSGRGERSVFLALARFRRARLMQYAVIEGWLSAEEAGPGIIADLRAAALAPDNPRGAEALINLWRRYPDEVGEDELAMFRDNTEQLVEGLRAAEGPTPRSRGPWASPLPVFLSGWLSLGLFQGHTKLALKLGRPAAARAFLDDFGGAIERPGVVRFCRGLILCHEGRFQEALAEVEKLPLKGHEFIIEVKARALARLGRRQQALEAIAEHHDPIQRRIFERLLDTRWKP